MRLGSNDSKLSVRAGITSSCNRFAPSISQGLTRHGPFLIRDGQRWQGRWMCYGPFPPRADTYCFPESPKLKKHFQHIKTLGFNGIRLYGEVPLDLLDIAHTLDLSVAIGPTWNWYGHFLASPNNWQEQMRNLLNQLQTQLDHPAVELLYVANEIPADLVRWIGPSKVLDALEWLINEYQEHFPNQLIGYANYPSTEYLQPTNADFSAFNIFLENSTDFEKYLRRLSHLANSRPLIISELGADSLSLSKATQADLVQSQIQICRQLRISGLTFYSYSDTWWNQGKLQSEWAFGLVNSEDSEKPSAQAARQALATPLPIPQVWPMVSVIVCSRDGAARIADCLLAIKAQTYANYEILVINDGSTDDTSAIASQFDQVKVITTPASGLSAARNFGAHAASGRILAYTDDDCVPHCDWLSEIVIAFHHSDCVAIGGPNLPPNASTRKQFVLNHLPDNATHVMLDDQHAEHLPGCNLAIYRETLLECGGFDPLFTQAGDDVDLCWRLLDAKLNLGFAPNALVWHYRRDSYYRALRQQWGYGKAEALLRERHPHRFNSDGNTQWQGCVYDPNLNQWHDGQTIYHGPQGLAAYQALEIRGQLSGLPRTHHFPAAKITFIFMQRLQRIVRRLARNGLGAIWAPPPPTRHR